LLLSQLFYSLMLLFFLFFYNQLPLSFFAAFCIPDVLRFVGISFLELRTLRIDDDIINL